MILSPEMTTRAIQAIIAPAVMISACAILVNGVILRYNAIDNLLRSFNQEVLKLRINLSEEHPLNRSRVHHLEHLIPSLLHHHHLLHHILALIYLAVFIFVIDMLAVAVSMSIPVLWVSYFVLAIFLVGVVVLCGSLFLAFYELRASHHFIQLELHIDCSACHPQRTKKRDRRFRPETSS